MYNISKQPSTLSRKSTNLTDNIVWLHDLTYILIVKLHFSDLFKYNKKTVIFWEKNKGTVIITDTMVKKYWQFKRLIDF